MKKENPAPSPKKLPSPCTSGEILTGFLARQARCEQEKKFKDLRLVGYALELTYRSARISTTDYFKQAVGGIPQGAFLVLASVLTGAQTQPANASTQCLLLRVSDIAPTPLASQMTQTSFELQKKALPYLDAFTQSELSWSALDCDLLGTFYIQDGVLCYAGDVENLLTPNNYKVYLPDSALLSVILNSQVRAAHRYSLGRLRLTECGYDPTDTDKHPLVYLDMDDIIGARTAMFGKTRLGKSNTGSLLMQYTLDMTKNTRNVGQLVFDINGEYCNDTAGGLSLRARNADRCVVYALAPRQNAYAKPLRLNFYETPDQGQCILSELLAADKKNAIYVRSYCNVPIPALAQYKEEKDFRGKRHIARKLQLYWAVLSTAGYRVNEKKLKEEAAAQGLNGAFLPEIKAELRDAAYKSIEKTAAPTLDGSLKALCDEWSILAQYHALAEKGGAASGAKDKKLLLSDALDADELALLNFLYPQNGTSAGVKMLQPYRKYHDDKAESTMRDIVAALGEGKMVLLDLASTASTMRRYFADMIAENVFAAQEEKFNEDALGDHWIQLYFEEAHNLFPANDKNVTGIYDRIGKEGAKLRLGMIYSTQSPSTISAELLRETENVFIGHISAPGELQTINKLQEAFSGCEQGILRHRTPGYMRMLTKSHRFVIPVQMHLYDALFEGV